MATLTNSTTFPCLFSRFFSFHDFIYFLQFPWQLFFLHDSVIFHDCGNNCPDASPLILFSDWLFLNQQVSASTRKSNILDLIFSRLIQFYKIMNGLAQVPFEGVLVEVYKGTRRKHNIKYIQIVHTTSQYHEYGQSCMEQPSFRWSSVIGCI